MSMTCKDSFAAFVRHLTLASGLLLVTLMGLEWLLPGSVLPFVDLIDLILPLVFLLLIATSYEASHTHLTLAAQILSVFLLGTGVLAMLALRMEDYNNYNIVLLGAGGLAVVLWAMAAAKGGEN